MSPEATSDLIQETRQERRRLLSLLEDLAENEWDAPSLCAGWRTREVVAHMTMPCRASLVSVAAGVVLNGFSFNRYADRAARITAAKLDRHALLADMRAHIDSVWTPPGGGQLGALSHDLIHGLDITEPLGLPRPPVDRVLLVLRGIAPRQVRYFGVNLDDATLDATDAPVAIGAGPTMHSLSASDILLVCTGRKPLPRPVPSE